MTNDTFWTHFGQHFGHILDNIAGGTVVDRYGGIHQGKYSTEGYDVHIAGRIKEGILLRHLDHTLNEKGRESVLCLDCSLTREGVAMSLGLQVGIGGSYRY